MDGLKPLEVLGAADLHLQGAEVQGAPDALAGALDGVDADRERGVRRHGREAEEPPQRYAQPPSDPVVKRAVERCLPTGHPVHVLEPLLDVLERVRVVADERRSGRAQELDDRIDGLAPVVHRRRLAAPDHTLVLQLDLHDGLIRARTTRDAERLGELKGASGGAQLHEPDSMTAGCRGRPRRRSPNDGH
jgi:hypothetical protein